MQKTDTVNLFMVINFCIINIYYGTFPLNVPKRYILTVNNYS